MMGRGVLKEDAMAETTEQVCSSRNKISLPLVSDRKVFEILRFLRESFGNIDGLVLPPPTALPMLVDR